MPLISTFTSPQERENLRRALSKKQRIIHICPQEITTEQELSPQPSGSRLNKQVATWCNEYVLRHASEIWVGNISPNGMLDTMLSALLKNE